jgi:hypothetical protein|tara:strand:+ start:3401 stop:5716 length:2316 start_codon:yes stop_codon:yes gene_type:complete
MSINRELSQLASFIDVQEDNNFIGISTAGTYTVGIGTSSVLIGTTGIITATQFIGPTGSSLIDHIDLQDEGNLVGTGFTTLNFVGAAITITQGVTGVATITVDSAVVGGEDGAVQFASGGSLTGISTLLFADSTNHRVGIGSSSPTSKLDVDGTLNVSGVSTFQDNVNLGDNDRLRIGDDADLQLWTDQFGKSHILADSAGHDFKIDAKGGLDVRTGALSQNAILATNNTVQLYYDNSKKFETTGAGVTVYGITETQQLNVSGVSTFQSNVDFGDDDKLRFGANQELEIYYNTGNGNSIIQENGSSGNLVINADNLIIRNSAANENKAKFVTNGSAILYHNAIEKFRTTGIGVSIVGTGNTATITGPENLVLDPAVVGDATGKVIILGDLQVDGTTTEINSTTLTVDDKSIVLASGAADSAAANGAGIEIDGASATLQYASTGDKWVFNKAPYYNTDRLLTTADEGTGNGLDADTLDGQEGTYYLDYTNFVGIATDSDKLDGQQGTYYLDYSNFVGVATDADKLDGQEGTYYLNYANFSGIATDSSLLSGISSTSFLRSDIADVKTSGFLRFNDSVEAQFGSGADLQLWHNGGQSYISNITGALNIRTTSTGGDINLNSNNDVGIMVRDRSETAANFIADGAVELYYDDVKKFETTGYGVTISGGINVSGIATAQDFNSASDENLKTNIRTIEDPLAKVVQIRGVNFDWKETQRPALGVIAQEVEKVLPELVTDNGTKTVNYNGLIGLLIETVKEQQKQIDTLSERLSKLE